MHIDYKPKDEKEHKEINTNYSTSTSKGQNENILNTRHLFYNLDEAVICKRDTFGYMGKETSYPLLNKGC